MPLPIQIGPAPVQNGIVILTGGVNEEVSNLELKEGELIDCLNYMELDGAYHGYASLPGFEVYDGTELASEVAITIDPDTLVIDDTAREARRAAITEVPGQEQLRGVHLYETKVYACRDALTAGKDIFEATDAGWVSIDAPELNPGGICDWTNALFPAFPAGDFVNTRSFFMVDGVSRPIYYNGYSDVSGYIDDVNLPSNQTGINLPQYPTHVAAFDNRLWLAYPNGQLFHSELGDPSAWDAVNGAGQIPTGDEITDLRTGPGNVLIVFMRNTTKIIYVAERPTGDFGYQLKEFSQRSGCFHLGSDRLLGDIYYVDDRGPTNMKTTDQFGDYSANSITKKVQRTFEANKKDFTCTVVHRELNQWRIFFNDGLALCLTFHNKRLKGATPLKYSKPVISITEGENDEGSIEIYFGTVDGFVYKMDSGTSFNGETIPTWFTTSYYHYRSPAGWKRFMSLLFEMSAQSGTTFYIKTDYDYKSPDSPRNAEQSPDLVGFGGIWGQEVWGEFIWGEAYVQNPKVYIQGYGVNMSISLRTEEKFVTPHVVHNFIANYQALSQKM